jgi:hypothetical protein
MRPRVIIGIVVALAIIIGGVIWYNNQAEQARLEEQRIEQAAIEAREAEEARALEEEAALEAERERQEALAAEEVEAAQEAEVVVVEPETPAALSEDGTVEAVVPPEGTANEEAAGTTEEDLPVVGDVATGDAVVVETTADPVIIDADETDSTARIVGEGETANPVAVIEPGTTTAATDAPPADTAVAGTTTPLEPAELLVPDSFDQDQVLVLIDESDQLTDQQRSTLRALVEGTTSNPATIDSAIGVIRAALDLPPLE